MVKGNKLAAESAEEHGLVDAFGPVPALDDGHAEQVAVGFIGMKSGSGREIPHPGSPPETTVFLMDYENIAIRIEQQIAKFCRQAQSVQAMA